MNENLRICLLCGFRSLLEGNHHSCDRRYPMNNIEWFIRREKELTNNPTMKAWFAKHENKAV